MIKGKAEEVELPCKTASVILSEWMGYLLIYENMLPSVLYIRDKYRSEGSRIIPYLAKVFIHGINLP